MGGTHLPKVVRMLGEPTVIFLFSCYPFVTTCSPLFPLVPPCSSLFPLLPLVTPCSLLFPLVSPCYSLLPLAPSCYLLLSISLFPFCDAEVNDLLYAFHYTASRPALHALQVEASTSPSKQPTFRDATTDFPAK